LDGGTCLRIFRPGSAFSYCNSCYNSLALLIERVTGQPYLQFLQRRIGLPARAALRPSALADWTGRALGFRRGPDGDVERADSFEGEVFYGSANLSIDALALAEWGTQWWTSLAPIRSGATEPGANWHRPFRPHARQLVLRAQGEKVPLSRAS
jgi:CubicO group peptidase (beta-lactamase class C family)